MGKIALLASLLGLLALSLWFAVVTWARIEGPSIPVTGYVALGLGILFSLGIGFGLMALLFYSHRHGYDEPPRLEDQRPHK